jgi:hypothetical protein
LDSAAVCAAYVYFPKSLESYIACAAALSDEVILTDDAPESWFEAAVPRGTVRAAVSVAAGLAGDEAVDGCAYLLNGGLEVDDDANEAAVLTGTTVFSIESIISVNEAFIGAKSPLNSF